MGSFCNGDMHMEKKQPVDILKSPEMMVYLTARQAVAEDAALKELLSSYQTKAAMLVAMVQKGNFSSEEVVALSADTERMHAELLENKKLCALNEAQKAVAALMAQGGQLNFSCSGSCGSCGSCNSCPKAHAAEERDQRKVEEV